MNKNGKLPNKFHLLPSSVVPHPLTIVSMALGSVVWYVVGPTMMSTESTFNNNLPRFSDDCTRIYWYLMTVTLFHTWKLLRLVLLPLWQRDDRRRRW